MAFNSLANYSAKRERREIATDAMRPKNQGFLEYKGPFSRLVAVGEVLTTGFDRMFRILGANALKMTSFDLNFVSHFYG